MPPESFVAAHLERTGELRVAAAAGAAMELFTPRGERLWVPDWNPVFLHPADGRTMDGGVFTTQDGSGATTHWMVTLWETETGRVRYCRITPGIHAADVTVTCRAAGAGATAVTVRYRLTALSERGNEVLTTWTEAWFRDYLASWETLLAAHLSAAPSEPPLS